MAKTSIHIEHCKVVSSELHNTRAKALDYVRPELTTNNAQLITESIADALHRIKTTYEKPRSEGGVGQKMQKTAQPIREGVVVLDPKESNDVLMSRLQHLSQRLNDTFGIKTIQTFIHRDEGHTDNEGNWKENCHAHLVFDWTNDKGKGLRLNRLDMTAIQTITAECLHMERGKSSDIKHLNSVQFKLQEEEARLQALVQTLGEKKEEAHKIAKALDIVTAQKEEAERKRDTADAEAYDTSRNTLALRAEVAQLKKEKEQLHNVVDPKEQGLFARAKSAMETMKEKGLSALSASDKDAIIATLTIERDKAVAQADALCEQFPYEVNKQTAELRNDVRNLTTQVTKLQQQVKNEKSGADTWKSAYNSAEREIEGKKSTIEALREENKRLTDLLPPLPKKLLEIGFYVKQIADMLIEKTSTILNPQQKLKWRADTYTAKGGESVDLVQSVNKEGERTFHFNVEGTPIYEIMRKQAETRQQQETKSQTKEIDNDTTQHIRRGRGRGI